MINKATFELEHIRSLQKSSGSDPILIERSLYAFGLLEALVRVGMPFIFKGGTSLLLLRTPPLLADFTHTRACKPFCEKSLTLP